MEQDDHHNHRVQAMHDFEDLAWLEVSRRRREATVAESAIWQFIVSYVEQTNEARGIH